MREGSQDASGVPGARFRPLAGLVRRLTIAPVPCAAGRRGWLQAAGRRGRIRGGWPLSRLLTGRSTSMTSSTSLTYRSGRALSDAVRRPDYTRKPTSHKATKRSCDARWREDERSAIVRTAPAGRSRLGDTTSAAAPPLVCVVVANQACGRWSSARGSRRPALVRDALIAECGAGVERRPVVRVHRQTQSRGGSVLTSRGGRPECPIAWNGAGPPSQDHKHRGRSCPASARPPVHRKALTSARQLPGA